MGECGEVRVGIGQSGVHMGGDGGSARMAIHPLPPSTFLKLPKPSRGSSDLFAEEEAGFLTSNRKPETPCEGGVEVRREEGGSGREDLAMDETYHGPTNRQSDRGCK